MKMIELKRQGTAMAAQRKRAIMLYRIERMGGGSWRAR